MQHNFIFHTLTSVALPRVVDMYVKQNFIKKLMLMWFFCVRFGCAIFSLLRTRATYTIGSARDTQLIFRWLDKHRKKSHIKKQRL